MCSEQAVPCKPSQTYIRGAWTSFPTPELRDICLPSSPPCNYEADLLLLFLEDFGEGRSSSGHVRKNRDPTADDPNTLSNWLEGAQGFSRFVSAIPWYVGGSADAGSFPVPMGS